MPEISLQNTSALVKYVEDLTKYQKVVAAVGMVADGSICICSVSYALHFGHMNDIAQ